MALKAKTFVDDEHEIEVELLTGPVKGLCKVAYGRRLLVRHVDRLTPTSDEAAAFLGKQQRRAA